MAPFVLFIFTVILLPVERSSGQIKCSVCQEDSYTFCTGLEKNCTAASACLSVLSETNLSTSSRPSIGYSRTCVEAKNNLTGSFYFDFGNERFLNFASKDCKEPACDAQPKDDPTRMFENGKYCPKCYRSGHGSCEEDGTVLCRGDLLNCTEINGVISHSGSTVQIPFAAKGCATASVGKIKQDQSFRLGTFTYTFKNIHCSAANSALASLRRLAFTLDRKDLGPQMAFFFPCILGIFAVKILS